MTEITAAIAHRKGKLEVIVTKALQAFVINGLASIHKSPEFKMTPTTVIHGTVYRYFGIDQPRGVYCALLSAYFAEWDRYTASATKVDHLLRHLNEHHIQGKSEKGKKGIYPIRLLHFVQWRSQVWQKVSSRIDDCVERAIQTDDKNSFRVFGMYKKWADLHPTCKDSNLIQLRKSLEAPFVDEVREHEIKVAKIALEIARHRAECAKTIAQNAENELHMLEEGHDSMMNPLHGEPIDVMLKSEEDVDDIMQSPSYTTLGGETVPYDDPDVGRYLGQLS
ncbi:unnamed protein product [Fusarium graminearum]|uniref:Chromosome 2, complete genome n=2 Tax=Gibberella zeae TaxID=5518 RepID=I1RL24_GIBZE|nr:hypothetical protein FGSG_04604 [Fusarium graminearum PH-1]EYB27917.1 hypothetical protein FG05_04604 [Fusarium graminearum]ESU08474.1 hypothetical protein FGSG_04604 [Fusarium graminearum PH-1]CAF3624547.1 unnamed protein product [Fusarium graminearum]CAF3653446.1 unnamed protein product [Fusarium graminearum]CAG1996040.1 unnamed protein product [Fusarium graminearum]|eukprot:XP_011320973.1 hypothetical protein FGSG_04604 [Fusarium graminearum PH-1]